MIIAVDPAARSVGLTEPSVFTASHVATTAGSDATDVTDVLGPDGGPTSMPRRDRFSRSEAAATAAVVSSRTDHTTRPITTT